MKAYTYGIVKNNHPDWAKESYFLDGLKKKPKDWKYKKTAKYVFIEVQHFADGSEGFNYISYSNDIEYLQKRLDTYISWYNHVFGYGKGLQQNIFKIP